MGRGRRGLLDDLVALPWPAGRVAGVLGFELIRYGIPAWASSQPRPLAQALERTDALAPLAWIVLAACAMASLFSWLDSRRKRRRLDAQTGLTSIAALGWQDFERLVGEASRRHGYDAEEPGLGGADGGIDLMRCKGGKRVLMQCKRWHRQQVGVSVVREMYVLLTHQRADEVHRATIGGCTPDAAWFAQGKPIGLIDGERCWRRFTECRWAMRRRRNNGSNPPRARQSPRLHQRLIAQDAVRAW